MSSEFKIERRLGEYSGRWHYPVSQKVKSRLFRRDTWKPIRCFGTLGEAEEFIASELRDAEGWPKYRPAEVR